MKKKKWLIPLLIIAVIALLIVAGLNVIASKGLGASVGRYLVTKNGQSMLVIDNSPIVMSNRTENDLFKKLEIGDEILVIHDGIAESYPAQTGAYAVFKLSDGTPDDISEEVIDSLSELGWLSADCDTDDLYYDNDFADYTVSYTSWTDNSKIYDNALNAEKIEVGTAKHFPVYKFDTLEEINQFKSDFSDILTMDGKYDEMSSFNKNTSDYDESFFDKNSLVLIYVDANSGSYRFGVDSVFCDGTYFGVTVEQINDPDIHTDDMAGWFVTLEVPKSVIENCTEFNATLIG